MPTFTIYVPQIFLYSLPAIFGFLVIKTILELLP